MDGTPPKKTFETALKELSDPDRAFPPASLYAFSELDRRQAGQLEAVWPGLPAERRLAFLEDLAELADSNEEVNAEAVCRVALEDALPEVRALAIASLWESNSFDLPGIFLTVLQHDPAAVARAAAASALGRFVFLAEVEELKTRQGKRIEEALLAHVRGDDELEVRRRALEALGYSSRPEVPDLIAAAYRHPAEPMRASALLAMGRSADERWREPVLASLTDLNPLVRYEAVRAAGELELPAALPGLIEALKDGDAEVRFSAIWALGQVGGERVRRALERLREEIEDEDEIDHIQETLDDLDFFEQMEDLILLDVAEPDDDVRTWDHASLDDDGLGDDDDGLSDDDDGNRGDDNGNRGDNDGPDDEDDEPAPRSRNR